MNCDESHMPTIGIMSQITHLGMQRAKELLDQYGLKPSQAGILFMLNHKGDMSQRELASKLNLTPPTITTAIQKMERLGFIKRQTDEKDQRIMRLSLTEKGASCMDHTKGVLKQMDGLMFRGLSKEENLLLRRLLIQIRDNMKDDDLMSFYKSMRQ